MSPSKIHINRVINLIPTIGILGFALLYFYSTTLYPGGSQANLNSEGFDWINNYWCNLMNEKGMNGKHNSARPFSIFAMILLCLSFMVFSIQFAETFAKNSFWNLIIKVGGILSMFFAILISTRFHDLMTLLSSFFGLFLVVGIIKEVRQSELTNYKITGIICLIFLAVNNLVYYLNQFIEWLPLLQKITFLIVLLWVLGLNYEIRKKIKSDFN
ncbi:MAG: hypothetical protein AB8F94_28145 [Saprospiraceae bacterium]